MASNDNIAKVIHQKSSQEQDSLMELLELMKTWSADQTTTWNNHLSLFMTRQSLSRVLYYQELYQKIIDVPGVICEFGVQWGGSLSLLSNLRGIYEPFNHNRKIFGFDTFEGFASVTAADGEKAHNGDYAVSQSWEQTLGKIMSIHQSLAPLNHIEKFELIKGDVVETCPKWLDDNPHAVVAMAIFDMDIYAPTKVALEAIMPRLTKGSLLVFDELSCQPFPGETQAVDEVIGLNNLRLRRHPHQPYCAYAIYGE